MSFSLSREVVVRALSAALGLFSCSTSDAQGTSSHRIQAVIPDLRSPQQAHEVDLALLAVPGVRMSRADHNTRNLLLEVAPDCPITDDQIRALLLPFDLALRCYARSPVADAHYVPLDPRSCEVHPLVR